MADEAADVFNPLLSSAMSTLQRIFERSFLVSAIVEKKQLVTQWIKEFLNNLKIVLFQAKVLFLHIYNYTKLFVLGGICTPKVSF